MQHFGAMRFLLGALFAAVVALSDPADAVREIRSETAGELARRAQLEAKIGKVKAQRSSINADLHAEKQAIATDLNVLAQKKADCGEEKLCMNRVNRQVRFCGDADFLPRPVCAS